MHDLVALLFGAVIIVFFSYERFNRATYEGGRQLRRLVDLLSPDQLRARRVFLNAYGFYAIALLLIYSFLCVYAELLPLLGGPNLTSDTLGADQLPAVPTAPPANATTGFVPSRNGSAMPWMQPLSNTVEQANTNNIIDIGIDASVSLTIALIMVGLAPTFPILQRFEDWMRSAAHRLAGIPTWVIRAGEDLRLNTLSITAAAENPIPEDTLLIPRGDWERMAHYLSSAKDQVAASDEFRDDLELIFAVSTWILDRKLKLGDLHEREREQFERLEAELRKRKDVLILELDELSGFHIDQTRTRKKKNSNQSQISGKSKSNEFKNANWDRLANDVENLTDDLCILLAIYVDHEIITKNETTDQHSVKTPKDLRDSSVRQQARAKEILEKFLENLLDSPTDHTHLRPRAMITWFWAFGVILLVTLLWSVFPGQFETALQRNNPGDPYSRALRYVFTAFNAYCVPMIVALAIRDGGIQSHHWRNMWAAHWTVRLPQALFVVFISWAIATLFIVGLAFWPEVVDKARWVDKQQSIWSALRPVFEYNAPSSLRGAILALIVVILLDTQSALPRNRSARPTYLRSLAWAVSAAATLALCGAITRYVTAWSSALNALTPRQSLDEIDRGLIIYAALYSGIIGFIVIFCIAEVLFNQRSAKGVESNSIART